MRMRSMGWGWLLAAVVGVSVMAPGAMAAKKAGKKPAVKGKVASVDAGAKSFVVNNKKAGSVTVSTNDQTKVVKQDGTDGAFADIKAGESVQVSGSPVADGKTTATSVKIVVKKKKAKKAA